MTTLTTTYGAALRKHAPARMVPVVFAGSIGTIIEWYDFLI